MTEIVEAELAIPEEFPDVLTGEMLPATTENAARVIQSAREMKDRIQDVIRNATVFLAEESRRRGTKTLPYGGGRAVLSGGASTEIDPEALRSLLTEAGCPEDRINAAVKEEISYKVDRAVCKQLAAANEDYAAAVELATRPIVKPFSVSVKS